DCRVGYCGRYFTCPASGKLDGVCIYGSGARNESVDTVAAAAELYFQAYLTAIKKGGGNPDRQLIKQALEVPLAKKTREDLEDVVWTSLGAAIGWDFMVPIPCLRSSGYMGNIRGVPGVEEGFGIANAVRQGFIAGLQSGDPQMAGEALIEYWQKNREYHPKHAGRCYPHGNSRVED